MRHAHTVTRWEVDQRWIKVDGMVREYPGGIVLLRDVGKRVYEVDGGILQVENDEQFRSRLLREAWRNINEGGV
jgi:hypothetical protein